METLKSVERMARINKISTDEMANRLLKEGIFRFYLEKHGEEYGISPMVIAKVLSNRYETLFANCFVCNVKKRKDRHSLCDGCRNERIMAARKKLRQ